VTAGGSLFKAPGQHPRSAESSLVDALKVARKAGAITAADLAAVGLARQSARAVDDALRAEERADNVATLVRAHLAVLTALGLTPAARAPARAGEAALADDPLVALGLDRMGPTAA